MAADPHPGDRVVSKIAERAVMLADANCEKVLLPASRRKESEGWEGLLRHKW
jgi:hypothetical protein